jgi:ubiquinone/menaquinone biosynthesis C-methylase UbiE
MPSPEVAHRSRAYIESLSGNAKSSDRMSRGPLRSRVDQELASRLTGLTQAQRSFVLGVIGAALLRDWHRGGDEQADRLAELFAAVGLFDGQGGGGDLPLEVPVAEGYAEWAPTYDVPNPMVGADQSLVRSLLAPSLRPGVVVLDAACGTGRHTAWLEAQGCRSVGVDVTAAMLRRARAVAPGTGFVQGDLRALPFASGSVDAAVCALALCHLPQLTPALRELARVLRPGGRLVVSDPHGRSAFAGGQGFYGTGGITRPRFVRNYHRQASEWIGAFGDSGFTIESCHEPRLDAASAAAHPVGRYFPEAAAAAFRDVPYLWIWSVIRRDG